jgi:hypothetical protein
MLALLDSNEPISRRIETMHRRVAQELSRRESRLQKIREAKDVVSALSLDGTAELALAVTADNKNDLRFIAVFLERVS